MPDKALPAHSLAEAHLYLMATACPSCGKGPLTGSEPRLVGETPREALVAIDVTCGSCQNPTTMTFQLSERPSDADGQTAAVISSASEPSRILDVGQWILLFRIITEAAGKEIDRTRVRRLGLEAAQCLEEALKFYDDLDNDLPPPEALFNDASRERFQSHPEQFSKRRLIELRSRLPSLSVMRSCLSRSKKKP